MKKVLHVRGVKYLVVECVGIATRVYGACGLSLGVFVRRSWFGWLRALVGWSVLLEVGVICGKVYLRDVLELYQDFIACLKVLVWRLCS